MQIYFTKKGITFNAFQSHKEIACFTYDEKLAEDFKKKENTFSYCGEHDKVKIKLNTPLKNETDILDLFAHFNENSSVSKIDIFIEDKMLRTTDCIVRNLSSSSNPFIAFDISLNTKFLTLIVNKEECFLLERIGTTIQDGLDYEQVYYSFSDLLDELESLPF